MSLIFYQNIIYFFFAIVTLVYVGEYSVKKKLPVFQDLFSLFFIICFSIVFANREFSEISDTGMYEYQYNSIKSFNDVFLLRGDYLFYILFYILKKFSLTFPNVLFVISIIFNALIYLSVKKLYYRFYFFLFFIIVSLFFYYAMITNIMRQGLAFAFFFYAYTHLESGHIKKFIFFILVSLGMHLSFLLPIGLLLIVRFISKINFSLLIYTLASVISVLNLKVLELLQNVPLISSLFKNRTDFNFIHYEDYKVGFRPDFFAFNSLFLLVGLFTFVRIKNLNNKNAYKNVLILYILLSSYFFLMFPYPFSDRYGVMSWIFIPLFFLPYVKSEIKIPFVNLFTIFLFFVSIYITFNVILIN